MRMPLSPLKATSRFRGTGVLALGTLAIGVVSLGSTAARAQSRRSAPTMTTAPDRTAPSTLAVDEEEEEPEFRQLHQGLEFGYIGLAAMAQRYSFDNYGLGTGEEEPDLLRTAKLRLRGEGMGYGGLFRFGYQSDAGFRFGLGLGLAVLDDVEVVHNSLPTGVTLNDSSMMLVNFQATFGKAFDLTHLYPYADLKVSANVVTTDIELTVPDYGLVGTTNYSVFTMSIAPRLGVVVPLDESVFIDGSVEYGLFGAERLGGQVHIGIMMD